MKASTHTQRGFSLVEMLVAMVMFAMTMLAVYAATDQMQALYARSERRSNVQGNARLVLENIERDFRLAGFGVPTGPDVSPSGVVAGASPWLPAVFYADGTTLRYRAESDNNNTQLTVNAPEATATRIHVVSTAIGATPLSIVLSKGRKAWQHASATSASSDANGPYFDLGSSVSGGFSSRKSQVFTIDHVFYRYVSNASYPYGTIQKATTAGNTPTTTVPADSSFGVLASNIVSCQFQYFTKTGTALTSFPLSATDRASIARIVVTITAREPDPVIVGTVQDVTMSSEVLVRNQAQ